MTNDLNSEPQVLISDLAQVKQIHWLKVVLTGTSSNREPSCTRFTSAWVMRQRLIALRFSGLRPQASSDGRTDGQSDSADY